MVEIKSWAKVLKTATDRELAQMCSVALDLTAEARAKSLSKAAARFRERADDIQAEMTRRAVADENAFRAELRAMGET